jgi:hypothetical protein
MSIRPAYQDWCLNGLTYLPLSQLEPVLVVPVPPEPPAEALPHVPDEGSEVGAPEAMPVGARTAAATAERAAVAAIPALVRMEVKPVSFVGRRG